MAEIDKERVAPPKKRKVVRYVVVAMVLVVLAVGGIYLWRYLNTYESTDDAQVDGHINSVSGRISGNVVDIRAKDQQLVNAGDVLVLLDTRDFEVALAKAQADLGDAEAALESSRIDVPITTTNTASQLSIARSSR